MKRKWEEWGEPDFLVVLLGVASLFVSAYAVHSFKFLVTVKPGVRSVNNAGGSV